MSDKTLGRAVGTVIAPVFCAKVGGAKKRALGGIFAGATMDDLR